MRGTGLDLVVSVEDLRRLRCRREVDRLDYLRGLRALAATMRQEELAKRLGVTQPAVSAALRTAREVPDVVAGFSGAGPLEIAQRYAAGLITHEQVVDELGRFPYAATPATDGVDWLVEEVANTVGDVVEAFERGFIDEDTYVQVQLRIGGNGKSAVS